VPLPRKRVGVVPMTVKPLQNKVENEHEHEHEHEKDQWKEHDLKDESDLKEIDDDL